MVSELNICNRQQALSTQKSELEELEARLRETEERLKNQQPSTSFSSSTLPAPAGSLTNHRNNNPRLRSDLDGAFDPPDDTPSRISVNAQHGDDGSDTERRQDGRSSRARPENHPPELSRGANPRSKNLEMRGQQTAESGSGNKDSAASLREKSRNKV